MGFAFAYKARIAGSWLVYGAAATMRKSLVWVCACTVLLSLVTGGPTDKRGPKDLSEEEHWEGDEHNEDYDHEAFLGREDASEFDNLPPEEAKRRLGYKTHEMCMALKLELIDK